MKNPLVRLPLPLIHAFSALHRMTVRASGGRLGTSFRGQPMILLTTTGRRSGRPRTVPLVALPVERGPLHGPRAGPQGAPEVGPEDTGWVVVASNGGHDRHPAWYLNVRASPEALVSDGRRAVRVRARDARPEERATQYPRFVALLSSYAGYQAATRREIPVVFLEPLGPSSSSRTADNGEGTEGDARS